MFPIGGSNRVCLGMPFALYEMKVVRATLFWQVRLARPDAPRPRARRYGLVLGPDDGGRIMVRDGPAMTRMHNPLPRSELGEQDDTR